MVEAVQRRQLVAEKMGGPVLRHAGADEAVERQGRRPHQVGAHGVVLGVAQGLGAFLDQGQQQAFGKAVLHLGVGRVGDVLLDHMHEGIDDAIGDLARRQGVGLGRVED